MIADNIKIFILTLKGIWVPTSQHWTSIFEEFLNYLHLENFIIGQYTATHLLGPPYTAPRKLTLQRADLQVMTQYWES